jgi:hypothetical protein
MRFQLSAFHDLTDRCRMVYDDHRSAVRDYSYQLYESLDIEIGIVAFGGSGFTHDGSGGVPPLIQSYDKLWANETRHFVPAPDLVIYNEGTNDGGDISADFEAVVAAVQAAAGPKCKQLLLLPVCTPPSPCCHYCH